MTKFEQGLKALTTERIEWCIGYLEKNGTSFQNQGSVTECIETMRKEVESRK